MTISFSLSAGELVKRAMQRRRCLGLGRMPTAAEMEYGLERLNLMLKPLGRSGAVQWAAEEATATITAGNPNVTLTPDPGEVISVGLVVSASFERPLAEWEPGQYDVLPNKTSVGDPTVYIVRETSAGTALRFWPVPSTNKTIKYRYTRIPEDVEQASPIDVPQDWLEDVETILADKLDAFANGNPDLTARAMIAQRRLDDASRPDSYFFEPDCA